MFFLRTTPVAPPFPDQWQTATEHHHYPPESPERPISAASSDRQSSVDNLRNIVASIYQNIPEKPFSQGAVLDSQIHSRPSTASRSQNDSDDEDIHPRTPAQPSIYATIQPQQKQHSRQGSYADSVQSISSSSTSRQSPVASLPPNYQQKYTPTSAQPQQQQKDEKITYRAPSTTSSRRSSDRFPPPPPPNLETLDLTTTKARPTSSISTRSSVYADVNEVNTKKIKIVIYIYHFIF